MNRYIATFHTHLSALMSERSLKQRGMSARMAPVPRALSSSCGTCVLYQGEEPALDAMDEDVEGVYLIEEGDTYTRLLEND